MAEPLRPQYFVTRQNGTMVPLIALDELPATVTLRGVPRTLSPYDVAGMQGLGTVESRHRQYVVDGLKQGFQPVQSGKNNGLQASKYAKASQPGDFEACLAKLELQSRAVSSSVNRHRPSACGIEESSAAQPNPSPSRPVRRPETANRVLTIEDLARQPGPGVKEYCSYWIRHGECDYAQQGCLYRHEMPLDRLTLENLGLRDIPRWYREKHGLGSYLALGAQNLSSGDSRMERDWRGRTDAAMVDRHSTTTTVPYPCTAQVQTPPAAAAAATTTATPVKPPTSTLNAWNAFPKNNGSVRSSSKRESPLQKPPPTILATLPRPHPPVSDDRATKHPCPGSRLVPVNTETTSARVLKEAIEQLNAREERQRAALEKYRPLVPQKADTPAADHGLMTPPSSSDPDGNTADEAESASTNSGDSAQGQKSVRVTADDISSASSTETRTKTDMVLLKGAVTPHAPVTPMAESAAPQPQPPPPPSASPTAVVATMDPCTAKPRHKKSKEARKRCRARRSIAHAPTTTVTTAAHTTTIARATESSPPPAPPSLLDRDAQKSAVTRAKAMVETAASKNKKACAHAGAGCRRS